MKFLAEIQIHILPEISEPQGNVLVSHMPQIDLEGIQGIRVGKHLLVDLEAESEVAAHEKIEKACQRLLANPVMETYSFHLKTIET